MPNCEQISCDLSYSVVILDNQCMWINGHRPNLSTWLVFPSQIFSATNPSLSCIRSPLGSSVTKSNELWILFQLQEKQQKLISFDWQIKLKSANISVRIGKCATTLS